LNSGIIGSIQEKAKFMKKLVLFFVLLLLSAKLVSSAWAQPFTTLYTFTGLSDGAFPQAGLVLSGNTLYGTASSGTEPNSYGVVFAVNTDGTGFTNLYNFTNGTDGAVPLAGLVLSGNTLYGTTSGGTNGYGTVFSVLTGGTGFKTLYSFTNGTDGSVPVGGLVLSGSTLYGTASQGGSAGRGSIFSIGTGGSGFKTLYAFTNSGDGSAPKANLLLSGSKLYGTASSGGSAGSGTVFSINTDGSSFQKLYTFTGGSDGATPLGALTISGNSLYGTASAGAAGYGSVFSLNTSTLTFSNLYSFTNGLDGAYPLGGLVLSGGNLYGAVSAGVNLTYQPPTPAGFGAVFSISTNGGNFNSLYAFTGGRDGYMPASGLILSGSTLYGTAYNGGVDPAVGSVFELNTTAYRLTTLVSFDSDPNYDANGQNPEAPLVVSGNELYGTAVSGAANGAGLVFSVLTNGAGGIDGDLGLNFNGYGFSAPSPAVIDGINVGTNDDGNNPFDGVLLSSNKLYGTADAGGTSGFGTIFSVGTNFITFTNLYNFTNGMDGANPQSSVIRAGNILYGTATQGGQYDDGTVYSLDISTTPPTFKPIYSFTGGDDGYQPVAGLVLSGNTLYGATSEGAQGFGVIFSVNTDGSNFKILYTFTGGDDGGNPVSTMLLSGNTLYGTASGGEVNAGTVFSFNLASDPPVFTTLHAFTGGFDGADPIGALILTNNILIGTTAGFGVTAGTIYAVGTDGAGFSVLYIFNGGTDGGGLDAGVTLSGNTLYGAAGYAGVFIYGTVFKLNIGNFTSTIIPIPLQIAPSGKNHVVLTWNDPSGVFALQSAPLVTGTYTNIPNATSPFTNAVSSKQQFFQLAAP
jgi:uncharacterized repeat protein (TIGR03803 family)